LIGEENLEFSLLLVVTHIWYQLIIPIKLVTLKEEQLIAHIATKCFSVVSWLFMGGLM
jgi:hypothetical protein